jgi:uncharacterized Zn finger protein (UPF0148 family)
MDKYRKQGEYPNMGTCKTCGSYRPVFKYKGELYCWFHIIDEEEINEQEKKRLKQPVEDFNKLVRRAGRISVKM